MGATRSTSKGGSKEKYVRTLSPPLPLQLLRARDAVMRLFRSQLRARGLTDQQGRILRVLGDGSAMEMLELAERACILPASLSRIIPKLEAKGFVRRQKRLRDNRRVVVSITAKGFRTFLLISQDSEAIYRHIRKKIGERQILDLYQCLDSLIAIAETKRDRESAR
ncbi:MAG: homoprotocatechuate degradation operon regulator HpaR [Alphaproteobacteria bacterium]